MAKPPKVAVLGIWHLGSVYSACLADSGYPVVGWDPDAQLVTNLNQGSPPLFEPGLADLVSQNLTAKRLAYTSDLDEATKGAAFVLMTFDTPVDAQDEVDLSMIYETSRRLATHLKPGATVIVSSQVPIGTCQQIKSIVREERPGLEFDVAYVPENLRLGQAIEGFKNPDRVVIGADSPSTIDKVEALFSVVNAPKVRMDLRSAEMVKHALNAFLGMCISFGNEIANLCDELGADALKVAAALHLDERVSPRAPIMPGLAFAGGTIARDLKVLQNLGDRLGYETFLVDGILKVNQRQNRIIVTRKLERIYGSLRNRTIGVLGLTYKAGTSTLRRSAAVEIIQDLVMQDAIVKAYDPKASLNEVQEHPQFQFCPNPYLVAEGSDALVIMTDWPEFKDLDFDFLRSVMKRPVLLDAKNMLDGALMTEKGFLYFGTGRGQRLKKEPE